MAKRLNPKRRRKLARSIALQLKGKLLNPSMVSDVQKTEFGPTPYRSSAKPHKINEAVGVPLYKRSPKPVNLEGNGKAGKVSRGKLIPPKRHNVFGEDKVRVDHVYRGGRHEHLRKKPS